MENLGSAKVVVELKDNNLYVYHGYNDTLIIKKPADKGTWDTIMNTLSKV